MRNKRTRFSVLAPVLLGLMTGIAGTGCADTQVPKIPASSEELLTSESDTSIPDTSETGEAQQSTSEPLGSGAEETDPGENREGEPPTLRKFLGRALEPVGETLYVYGGGWNTEDTGAGMESRTLGLSDKWKEFFDRQDSTYDYLGDTYPVDGQNLSHELGLDCSGFVGWVLYNTLEKEDGLPGYVEKSTDMAYALFERGWGSFEEEPRREDLRPGDIISIKGHVWICLGVCEDSSVLLVHSTPAPSRTGTGGGGVCISSIGGSDSVAGELSRRVMSKHYPAWYERYEAPDCSEGYLSCPEEKTGSFRFYCSETAGDTTFSVLSDPEGMEFFGGEEILKYYYGEEILDPNK